MSISKKMEFKLWEYREQLKPWDGIALISDCGVRRGWGVPGCFQAGRREVIGRG